MRWTSGARSISKGTPVSYPILRNSREFVDDLLHGREGTPEIEERPSGVDLQDGHFRALGRRLTSIRKDVEETGDARTAFDSPAAVELHRQLDLDLATAADKSFWAYLAAVRMPNLVRWRWGATGEGDHPPANRYRGGWKNTFRRLWYRADMAYREELDDSYRYVDVGGEDFWVGLLEREISECRNVVRELLPYWSRLEEAGEGSMIDHRCFFIVLRLLRPYRAYERLQDDEVIELFDRALELSREDWVREYAS